jgi:hypothetical protein
VATDYRRQGRPELSPKRSQQLTHRNKRGAGQKCSYGASFAPEEEKESSASIGGTIKLEAKHREPVELLLSVFHPFKFFVTPNENASGWNNESAQSPIKLRIPSKQDEDYTKRNLEWRLNTLRENIQSRKSKFEYTGEERYQTAAAQYEESYQKVQNFHQEIVNHSGSNQGLGYLHYGSGIQSGLDWSLSSFSNLTVNNTPPTLAEIQASLERDKISEEYLHKWLDSTALWNEINLGRIEPNGDDPVIKRGRTTRVSTGRVNAIPSEVFHNKSLNLQEESSFGVCAVLTGESLMFSGEGDSGAWVLNKDADWVGVISGIHRSCSTGKTISLVVEAEKIVANIEALTGKKVVSPKWRLD